MLNLRSDGQNDKAHESFFSPPSDISDERLSHRFEVLRSLDDVTQL